MRLLFLVALGLASFPFLHANAAGNSCMDQCQQKEEACYEAARETRKLSVQNSMTSQSCKEIYSPCMFQCESPLEINGKDYGIKKQSIRLRINELASLAGGDVYYDGDGFSKPLQVKIDMDSRKKYFTSDGWKKYQKYVELVKGELKPNWFWRLLPHSNTESFSLEDGRVVFSYDCESFEYERDMMSTGSPCRLDAFFIKDATTGDILIDGWKFTPVGTQGPPSFIPEVVTDLKVRAKSGDLKAQSKLVQMYWMKEEALKWCRMAADQGDTVSQGQLGRIYENGWGTEKDNAEAYFWYSLSMRDESGKKFMWHKKSVAEKLTPEQISALDKRIAKWKPTLSKKQ